MINLFQLVRNPGKTNASDEWPAHSPIGMYFDYEIVNKFMKKWPDKKEELKTGKIMNNEYLEWKLNWPHTQQ